MRSYKVFESFMNSYKIRLVRPWLRFQPTQMLRFKTLSLPILTAAIAASVVPASADLVFSTSTNKSYREVGKGLSFTGGTYEVFLRDGNFTYQSGCVRADYWRPNIPMDPCPLGSTGFLLYGALDNIQETGSYFSVIQVISALAVEPRRPDLVSLIAAPASKLPRPSKGFADNSYALYYNLHLGSAPEYVISSYKKSSQYSSAQRSKFESEIVKGVYKYTFPRLKLPDIPAPVSATIFPMAEGTAKLNNKVSGFDFDGVLKKKIIKLGNLDGLPPGFVELSFLKPNTLIWKGLTPADVYSNVDQLYFSIRVMENPADLSSTLDLVDNVTGSPQAIFPPYITGGNPRIRLASPYVTSFVVPPILEGGARGVVQLELSRAFNTGGVAYDFSNRKFEIPIIIVNRYTDYAEIKGIPKANILDDTDEDGFNNLNEWILSSDANVSGSVPTPPRAGTFGAFNQQYGFEIRKKLLTVPAVNYILQRSFDNGVTWNNFVSDGKWTVTQVDTPAGTGGDNIPARSVIRVESKFYDANGINQVRPPGTENETYRVKITL